MDILTLVCRFDKRGQARDDHASNVIPPGTQMRLGVIFGIVLAIILVVVLWKRGKPPVP